MLSLVPPIAVIALVVFTVQKSLRSTYKHVGRVRSLPDFRSSSLLVWIYRLADRAFLKKEEGISVLTS